MGCFSRTARKEPRDPQGASSLYYVSRALELGGSSYEQWAMSRGPRLARTPAPGLQRLIACVSGACMDSEPS